MFSKLTQLNHKTLIHTLAVLGILSSIAFFIYFQKHPDFFAINGPFQHYLYQMGIWAPLIFILVQIIQVIYPIIPGGLTCVLGHVMFGPLWGFIYNSIGIFIGSIAAFLLARNYGETFAKAFVSDKTYDKYIPYLNKGSYFEGFLVTAFLLPGFPDDFLCMVSGLSKITLKNSSPYLLFQNLSPSIFIQS